MTSSQNSIINNNDLMQQQQINQQQLISPNQHVYKQACSKLCAKQNNLILFALKGNDLNLNIDSLHDYDVSPLQIVLENCSFRQIELQGNYSREEYEKDEQDKKKLEKQIQRLKKHSKSRSPSPSQNNSNKDNRNQNEQQELEVAKIQSKSKPKVFQKLFFSRCEQINEILQTIGKCIERSLILTSLQIQNLNIEKPCWRIICSALAKSKSVQQIKMSNCYLTSEKFQEVYAAITKPSTVQFIDLSNNFLCDKAKDLIKKIIKKQGEYKEHQTWMQSLRDDKNKILMAMREKGIQDINFSNNQLSCETAKAIGDSLLQEKWLKSLDLSHNRIEAKGINYLINSIRENQSLLSLKLEGNPGYSSEAQYVIYDKVVQNLDIYSSLSAQVTEPKLDKDTIQIENKKGKMTSPERKSMENIIENSNIKQDSNNGPTQNKEQQGCQKCLQLLIQNQQLKFQNFNLQMQIKKMQEAMNNLENFNGQQGFPINIYKVQKDSFQNIGSMHSSPKSTYSNRLAHHRQSSQSILEKQDDKLKQIQEKAQAVINQRLNQVSDLNIGTNQSLNRLQDYNTQKMSQLKEIIGKIEQERKQIEKQKQALISNNDSTTAIIQENPPKNINNNQCLVEQSVKENQLQKQTKLKSGDSKQQLIKQRSSKTFHVNQKTQNLVEKGQINE